MEMLEEVLNIIQKMIDLKKFITSNPLFISENAPASKALSIMNERKITSFISCFRKRNYNKA